MSISYPRRIPGCEMRLVEQEPEAVTDSAVAAGVLDIGQVLHPDSPAQTPGGVGAKFSPTRLLCGPVGAAAGYDIIEPIKIDWRQRCR